MIPTPPVYGPVEEEALNYSWTLTHTPTHTHTHTHIIDNTCSLGLPNISATAEASAGCPAGERKFDKAWSQTLVMFFGEFMCIFLFFYNRRRARQEALFGGGEHGEPGGGGGGTVGALSPVASFTSPTLRRGKADGGADEGDDKLSRYNNVNCKSTLVCLLPALCDLGGTTISGIGLLFTTASIFQVRTTSSAHTHIHIHTYTHTHTHTYIHTYT